MITLGSGAQSKVQEVNMRMPFIEMVDIAFDIECP